MPTSIRRSIALAGLLVAAGARAEDLPPKDAPAYTGVYQLSSRGRDDAQGSWDYQSQDTITIATLGRQSRWDFKSDGRTAISDLENHTTITFGGKIPANTAYRTGLPFTPIGWEFGYANVAAAAAKPEVLGTKTIAGQPCTQLRFTSDEYGTPEYCVAKNGIVLRFSNASATSEAAYEAQSINPATPEKDRFSPPAGYNVEDPTTKKRKP